MWTEEKQRLLDSLREKEFTGTLTSDEQEQLEQLFAEIDQEEAEMLRPAMERMDREIESGKKEIEALEAENSMVEAVLAKREALLARVNEMLAQFKAEDQALQDEYEKIVSHRQASF